MNENDIALLGQLLSRKVNELGHPNTTSIAVLLRDIDNMRLNSKVLASRIAELTYYNDLKSRPPVGAPSHIGVSGRICREEDFSASWFFYWADQLKYEPRLHRKLWEDTYVLHCLWELGALEAGKSGVGFAVGVEPLPAYFAGRDIKVLASDLEESDPRAETWRRTDQHASAIKPLWREHHVSWDRFSTNCEYRAIDMTSIPSDIEGKFDFCWSICAFEHLGSIEKGLQFVCDSVKTLKKGGIAVHTTEYNFDQTQTVDNWPTVLFQRQHFETLQERLAKQGDKLLTIDYNSGTGFFDSYVDTPPFPHQYTSDLLKPDSPHVKLSVDGFPVTSIAIIAVKG